MIKTVYFRVAVILTAVVFFFSSCALLDAFLSNRTPPPSRNSNYPPPSSNYVVLMDYGLMVMTKDIGRSTMSGGRDMCAQLRLGGFSDWRLPAQGELAVLYNERHKIGGFETVNNTRYWSSTPSSLHGGGGFYVYIDFSNGSMGNHLDMSNQQPLTVRCVRNISPSR